MKAGHRTIAPVAAAAALLSLAVVGWAGADGGGEAEVAASARGGACPAVSLADESASVRQARRALRCRFNRLRERRGRVELERDRRLKRAAQRHAKKMAKTDCLEFRCPGERSLEGRLEAVGYFNGARRWEFAENTGCAASVGAMFDRWAESSYHRENILNSRFDEVGIGIAKPGPPSQCEDGFAAFSAVFAWRNP